MTPKSSSLFFQSLLKTDLSQVNFYKVTAHTVLGGISVYVGAKSQGIAEYPAIFLGVVAALGAGFGSASNTQKDADKDDKAEDEDETNR